MAENGKFVSRMGHGGSLNKMEASKDKIDQYTRLRCSVLWNGKVSFRADDGGHMYLSRFDRGGVQYIEPAKSALDVYCEFSVETDANGPWNGAHYVYFKADNGKYAGIADRDGRHNMEATFDSRSSATRFVVLEAI